MADPQIFRRLTTLRMVALLELLKGLLVLLAGCGVLSLLHRDVGFAAEELVRHLHLNPASHMPRIFIDAASNLNDSKLWLLAAAALGYSLVRAVEATGLWFHKSWAEWFGALTGGIYIPFEVYELVQKLTWARVAVLAVNLVVVGTLALELARTRPGQETFGQKKNANSRQCWRVSWAGQGAATVGLWLWALADKY